MAITYIVGGTPRSGKSLLQKYFLENYRIPGVSTDLLREGLQKGVPMLGLRDEMSDAQKTEALWDYFRGILLSREYYKTDLLIEGTNFAPKYLAEFAGKPEFRMCFLGFCEVDIRNKVKKIREIPSPDDDWTDDMSDDELYKMTEIWVKISRGFREECEKYKIRYFDTSQNLERVIVAAAKYLRGN